MSSNVERTRDPLPWLLDPGSPGVRYLTLRDLLGLPADDPELQSARRQAHEEGPIAKVLDKMQPEGYWEKPGPGYGPKYKSSVWAMILLGQLGACIDEDERIARACNYMLEHTLAPGGQFSYNGAPSGTFDCLQGNLCWALSAVGCTDSRLDAAYEWMARSVTGEGVAPLEDKKAPVRYYAYKCGPNFACGANYKQDCAWGAAKIMLAFSQLPAEQRTALMLRAIEQGAAFLFSTDPARADYPSGINEKPSRNWWLFGFPVFYVADILQIVEALAALGYAADARLDNAWQLILSKRDAQGRWPLEYHYTSKTWGYYGRKGQPNPWVTMRALRALGHAIHPTIY